MIKRVNFTGRRRVPRSRVDVQIFDETPRTFDAFIDLNGLEFLPEAAVFLEATTAGSTTVERFYFGPVSRIEPPANRNLDELEGDNLFFTLKIVDQSESIGRILGIAEHIHPEFVGNEARPTHRGILPVESASLGQEIWRLDLSGHAATLLVNEELPDFAERLRSDPMLFSIIYPTIVRIILEAAISEGVDIEEDEDRWPFLWLRFGKNLHPDRLNPPKNVDGQEERDEWISEIVSAFCDIHEFKEKLISVLATDGGEI